MLSALLTITALGNAYAFGPGEHASAALFHLCRALGFAGSGVFAVYYLQCLQEQANASPPAGRR